jgi:Arc-like DNA binding dprotein
MTMPKSRRKRPPVLDLNVGAREKKVQLKVRLSDRLRYQLERAAARTGHSMNSEIVTRLFRSFRNDEDSAALLAKALVEQHFDVAQYVARLVRYYERGELPPEEAES